MPFLFSWHLVFQLNIFWFFYKQRPTDFLAYFIATLCYKLAAAVVDDGQYTNDCIQSEVDFHLSITLLTPH